MTQTPDSAPVSELSYEQARDELVALVARIESGKVPLEESMVLWERGEQLAAHCQAKLDAAQESLDRASGPDRGAGAASPAPSGDVDVDADADRDPAGSTEDTGPAAG